MNARKGLEQLNIKIEKCVSTPGASEASSCINANSSSKNKNIS
jgi:hypothetical protein